MVDLFLKVFAGMVFIGFLLAARSFLSFENVVFICFSIVYVQTIYADVKNDEREKKREKK